MNALVWLEDGARGAGEWRVNTKIPVLRRAERSGGSRAANADGAPRKHGRFHSRGRRKSQRAPAVGRPGSFAMGPGRIASHGLALADIPRHHAAGPDHRTVADGDAG